MSKEDFITEEKEKTQIFGVFSAVERCPVIRGWAKSVADAQVEMKRIKTEDAKSEHGEDDDYYVVNLGRSEVEWYKKKGCIDAYA